MSTVSKNGRGALQVEIAEWLDGLLGREGMKDAASWRYHAMSRERNGHTDHWLVPAITDIRTLDVEIADALVGRLVDELNVRLLADDLDIRLAQIEEQESDGEEDIAGVIAMQDPSKRRLHLDRLERHRAKVDRLIWAYRRDADTLPRLNTEPVWPHRNGREATA